MDLDTLRLFRDVARRLSFAAAAAVPIAPAPSTTTFIPICPLCGL